jgi:hypothetical protein
MKRIFYISLAVLLITVGCSEKKFKDHLQPEYPDDRYFTAKGIGQSEKEARNEAIAEMSRIFESKVFSETYDRAISVIDETGSEISRSSIESNLRVVSAVELKGVHIAKTWFDDEEGIYYALAILDRYQAKENWESEIKDIDNRIEGEFKFINSTTSKYLKLTALRKIINYWMKREVLVSRLRVLGFRGKSSLSYDIKTVFSEMPRLRADTLIYIKIDGKYGREIESRLTEVLSEAGFMLGNNRQNADILITGSVKVEPVELTNPDWKFARAKISLKIIDTSTRSTVGEISVSTRAGHLSYKEAVYRAVKKARASVSERFIEYFE